MEEDLYIQLIYKQLSGEINQTEQGQLDAWLASAEENRQTLADLSAAWGAAAEITPVVTVDLEEEFALLNEKIQAEEQTTNTAKVRELPPRSKNSSRRFWLVAASILFLATALFFSRDFFSPTSSNLVEVKSGAQIQELQLPDGSLVFLNKNSSLSYPEQFSTEERKMQLQGEAFFEVVPDQQKPFKVQFANSTVEVLGTSFNIKAMENEDPVVQVKTGTVKWNNSQSSEVLQAGMTATFVRGTGKISNLPGNSSNADYWRNQELRFDEVAVKYVLQELEKLFAIQFKEPAKSLEDCLFTANFDAPSLDEILETLATVFDVEVIKIDSHNYQLNGGGCQ